MNTDIYDLKTALKRIGNNEKLFDKYLTLSLQEIPVSLDKLKHASASDNLKSVIVYAHSVKTMAATIGANRLRDAALALENSGKSGDIANVHLLINRVSYEFEKFTCLLLKNEERS